MDHVYLKAKTHGINSCIVISVYQLDILKKATEYHNN